MKIETIIRIKILMILLSPVLMIIIAWEQINFTSPKELIVFISFILFTINKDSYEGMKDEIKISYYMFEILIFLINMMLTYKIYIDKIT